MKFKQEFGRLKIGPYEISEWPDDLCEFWIQHEDGEGMGTSSHELKRIMESPDNERLKLLEAFWKAEF